MNKKRLTILLIALGILVIGGFSWLVYLGDEKLNGDDMCAKVQTTCCPCSMSGQEKCVLAEEAEEYASNLESCSPNTICAAVYSCSIKSCEYIDGQCLEK